MDMADHRGGRLRDFDACVAELKRHFAAEVEGGGRLAEREAAALAGLAAAIRAAVAAWAEPLRAMHLAAPLDPARAASIVAEAVFDEILIAPAWRVLAAGLEAAA